MSAPPDTTAATAPLTVGETAAASPFELPASIVTEASAVFGRRGTGKTYTASVVVEEVLARGQQVIVVDPTDAWWGLKSSADGEARGFPIPVLGGPHGDLPLEEDDAAALADFAVDTRASMILSLRHLKKPARTGFVTRFNNQLYHRKGELASRTPLLAVYDEARLFCLSEDTEILTADGWRRHEALTEGLPVVAYDPATDTCAVEPIQKVSRRHYSGPMVHLATSSLDCLCTPDHRVVLRRQQRAPGRYGYYPWTFCRAEDVPTSVQIPAVRPVAAPGIAELSEKILRVIGWVLTDGYVHQRSRTDALGIQQSLATTKAGRNIAQEMDELLTPLGATRCLHKGRTSARRKSGRTIENGPSYAWYLKRPLSDQVYRWLDERPLPPSTRRRVPRALIEGCSEVQLAILMRGLMEGDGSYSKRGDYWSFYAGLNEGMADDVQEIATRLGWRSTKRYEASNRQWSVLVGTRTDHWVRRPASAEYDGVVWDITVPSGAFVARRNGRVFITGNCPQRVGKGDEAVLDSMDDVVRLGRASGLGAMLVDQRPASVNKDVLSQLEVLVCHRLVAPQDRRAIDDWIRQHDTAGRREEFLAALASLPGGHAWFWLPARDVLERVRIRERETYDSSRTPELGEIAAAPAKIAWADADTEALKEALLDPDKERADEDPESLRRRVRDLESALARSVDSAASARPAERPGGRPGGRPADVEREVRRRVAADLRARVRAIARPLRERHALLEGRLRAAGTHLAAAVEALDPDGPNPDSPTADAKADAKADAGPGAGPIHDGGGAATPGVPRRAPGGEERAGDSGPALPAADRALLGVLRDFAALGVPDLDRRNLALVAGSDPAAADGRKETAALRRLMRSGLVRFPEERLVGITPAGEVAAEEIPFGEHGSLSLSALHDRWLSYLPAGEARLLRALLDEHPEPLSRKQLASRAGLTHGGGAFWRTLKTFSGRGLAELPNRRPIRLTDLAFPRGLN